MLKEIGRDNFKLTILYECSEKELNTYEKKFISERKTLHPHGYNMQPGGSSCSEVTTQVRELISKAVKTKNKDLPMYLTRNYQRGKLIGYMVQNHPKHKSKITFTNTKDPESVYEKALECLDYLNNLGESEEDTKYNNTKPRRPASTDLPKYITRTLNKNKQPHGYRVNTYKENEPVRTFSPYNETSLEKAIDYLSKLMQDRMQLRE